MSVQCISGSPLKVEHKPRNMSHNIEIASSYFMYTSQRARIISLSLFYSSSAFWVISSGMQYYPGSCQSEKNLFSTYSSQQFSEVIIFYLHTTIRSQHDVFNQNLCLLSSLISLLISFPLCICLLSYAMCLHVTSKLPYRGPLFSVVLYTVTAPYLHA